MSPIWPDVYLHTLPSPNAVRIMRDDDFISECAIIHRYVNSVVTHSCCGVIVLRLLEEPGTTAKVSDDSAGAVSNTASE